MHSAIPVICRGETRSRYSRSVSTTITAGMEVWIRAPLIAVVVWTAV